MKTKTELEQFKQKVIKKLRKLKFDKEWMRDVHASNQANNAYFLEIKESEQIYNGAIDDAIMEVVNA